MPVRYLIAPFFLAVLMLTTACVDDPETVAGCSPVGTTNTCTCSDGRTGSQTCQEDLSFGTCVCEGNVADAGNGGDTTTGEDGGGGEVIHVNLNEGDSPWSYEIVAGGEDSPVEGDRDEATGDSCEGFSSAERFLRLELPDPLDSLRIEVDGDDARLYVNGPVHRCNIQNIELFPAENGEYNIHVTLPEQGREEMVHVVFYTDF